MKRFGALVLAVVLVLSFAACGKGNASEDPFTRFEAVSQTLEDAKSAEVSAKVHTEIKANGEEITQDMDMIMKMVFKDPEAGIVDMEVTMEIPNAGTQTFYIVDNVAYYDMEDLGIGRFKMDMSGMMEDFTAQAEQQLTGVEFTREDVDKAEMETLENGDTKITFGLKPEMMNEIYSTMMGSLGEMMNVEGLDMTTNNITYTLILDKKDNPKSYGLEMDLKVSVEGETVETHMTMEAEYLGINTINEITVPGNLDDYEEMDSSMLFG